MDEKPGSLGSATIGERIKADTPLLCPHSMLSALAAQLQHRSHRCFPALIRYKLRPLPLLRNTLCIHCICHRLLVLLSHWIEYSCILRRLQLRNLINLLPSCMVTAALQCTIFIQTWFSILSFFLFSCFEELVTALCSSCTAIYYVFGAPLSSSSTDYLPSYARLLVWTYHPIVRLL
jgi:hypothetical protein